MTTKPSLPAGPGGKTLVLHIGDHKTGSTSIQYAFANGRVALDGRRLFYPAGLSHNHLRGPAEALFGGKKKISREEAAQTFTRLARRIRKADADLALISAEALDAIPAEQLRQIVETYFAEAADEIRVVAYVRPHAARILSSFATQTKSGLFNSGPLEAFHDRLLSQGRLFYHPRFAALRAAFGERFLLRPMIRARLEAGDVLTDFIRHGLGVDRFEISGLPPANESLSLEDMMRLKHLQSHHQHLKQNLRHALGWEVMRLLAEQPPAAGATRLELHRSLAEQIRATYLEDARAMDRAFFGGEALLEAELNAAVENARPTAQSVAPEDHFSASELRGLELMSRMAAGLSEVKDVDWVNLLRRKRIAALGDGPDAEED